MTRLCATKKCPHNHKGLCGFKDPEANCTHRKKLKEMSDQLAKVEQELKQESLFEVKNDIQ